MKKIRKQIITTKTIIPLLLISLALIFSFTMSTVSAQFMSPSPNSSVIYVNGSNGSDDNDGLSWETAKLSIKNATGTVNTNGTVRIANGTYTGADNTNININKNMNIIGESQTGTIINGTNTNWIFNIQSNVTLILQNLTLTNGNATTGGAILNQGNLTVNNCTFRDNSALSGGVIRNNQGNSTFNGCTFTGNTAQVGGAIYNLQEGTLIVKKCTFKNNIATHTLILTGGGAIYGSGNATIVNCNFINNTAIEYGGAINNGAGNWTINGCTFTGNTACNGSAIYNHAYIAVTDCTFNNNTASDCGGAICNNILAPVTRSLNVTHSTFIGNEATNGGAIFGARSLNLSFSSFLDNRATENGGAIYCSYNSTIISNNFINNTANGLGGVIFVQFGYAEINFNRIIGNSANEGNAIYSDNSFETFINAENNWWGSNEPVWNSLISGFTNPTNWVILTVTANPTTINNTQTSTITADFNHINGGDLVGGHIPDGPITLDIPWGSFTSSGITHSVTVDTIDGNITATFFANEGALSSLYNPISVNATADGYTTNDTESAYITINPAADISVNETFEDTNHNHITSANYQDTVVIHLNVTNNGPDMANWVVIDDIIPADIIPIESDDGYLNITSNSPVFGYVIYGSQRLTIYIGDIANGTSYDVWINVTNVGHNNSMITNTARLNTIETYPYDPNPDNNNSTDSYTANTSAYLYITITSNKNNPKVSETFIITYKLKNKGPDAAQNVTITIPLPQGFEIFNISGDGNWTYNANNNIITWTLTNVPAGDPYLYLSGNFLKAGSYVFSSSISSETYNINTEGVTPITIKAANEVKAASKTIGMQKTGLPIAGLILAILALFGGLATSKRK